MCRQVAAGKTLSWGHLRIHNNFQDEPVIKVANIISVRFNLLFKVSILKRYKFWQTYTGTRITQMAHWWIQDLKVVGECMGSILQLVIYNKVTLVPRHTKIEENEAAGTLAKQDATSPLVGTRFWYI